MQVRMTKALKKRKCPDSGRARMNSFGRIPWAAEGEGGPCLVVALYLCAMAMQLAQGGCD